MGTETIIANTCHWRRVSVCQEPRRKATLTNKDVLSWFIILSFLLFCEALPSQLICCQPSCFPGLKTALTDFYHARHLLWACSRLLFPLLQCRLFIVLVYSTSSFQYNHITSAPSPLFASSPALPHSSHCQPFPSSNFFLNMFISTAVSWSSLLGPM